MIPTPYTSLKPNDDFGLTFSNLKYSANLAASVEATLTVPGNARTYKALMKTFPVGSVVVVALNATAVLPIAPAGNVLNATSSEIIDVVSLCREVKSGDVLHFIASSNNTPLSVVLYALNTNN